MISKNSIIYQAVTDRYNNKENNLFEAAYRTDYNDKFQGFIGGTFKGIAEKAEYLQELGVTHLLISPHMSSSEYHGYSIDDHFSLNPHFGTDQDLEDMLHRLRKIGIGIIIDYVPTHISSKNNLFEQKRIKSRKDRERFLFIEDILETKKYHSYMDEVIYKLTDGNTRTLKKINPGEYLGYFGLPNLPLLNLMHPINIKFHKQVLKYWYSRIGYDAVRFDSGFIQPRSFIKEMQGYLNDLGSIDILTEYWGFEKSHGKGYGFSGADCYGFSNGEFDIGTTLELNFRSHEHRMFERIIKHYYHFREVMEAYKSIVSINNHDIPRCKSELEIKKILATLTFTIPAIPLIYYGDEIGMRQIYKGHDRIAQSRDVMLFNEQNQDMLEFYKRLIMFRKRRSFNNDQAKISEVQINDQGSLLTYQVAAGKQIFYVLLNKEEREKPVRPELLFYKPNMNMIEITSGKEATVVDNHLIIGAKSANIFLDKNNS